MARKQKGYTIVEVMIFLAVSGALLAFTVIGMGGQQEKVRFKQSMEDIELRIRSTLNNVDQGYAAKADNNKTYSCDGTTVPTAQETGENIIQNASCVFVGREINFCNPTNTYIVSKVAPFKNADYANSNVNFVTTDVNPETFAVSAGVYSVGTYCSVAALYQTVGVSNNRVPRYFSTSSGSFAPVNDSNPAILCFTNGNKYATLTVTQADIKLLVDSSKCN